MSPSRRAGAPRLIEWTGERCVPWAPDVQVVYEHFHRYLWAARLVGERRVLDLGSGEGFGAAILADSATHVVGVDVDELTVQHSKLNYRASNLEFSLGSALDLTDYPDGSFDAVVAFEIIEHVRDQERVLAEVARLLSDDGILIISTPDRQSYEQARSEPNPFHERELSLEEFLKLLGEHFPHVSAWAQRTVTGSHLNAIDEARPDAPDPTPSADFFIERAGEEWRVAGDPAPLYCVAVASKAPLPATLGNSTLADCGLQLMRVKERDAAIAAHERDELLRTREHERAEHVRTTRLRDVRVREELKQRDRDILRMSDDIAKQQQQIATIEGELAAARQLNRRVEESVTWHVLQRARGRLYGAIGENSTTARALGMALRLAGRLLTRNGSKPADLPASDGETHTVEIAIPEFENPLVSLIIPVYAHAELTRACLNSIRTHTTHVSYEVIVIDDASDEQTKQLLRGVEGARIIHNKQNLGYLRSMNRGAQAARGDWLVLCNNDIEVTEGWLRAMLECAQSAPDVGVVTPKFLYPDGSLNEAGAIIWRDGTGANYGRGDAPDLFQYEYRREVDYGSAAALLVRAELWNEVGGFDERYLPMYYEDVDLCFQVREHGLLVLYEPAATVVHIEGATAGGDIESGHKRHQEQNRPKFVERWRERLQAENLRDEPTNLRVAANRYRGPHVLVIDHHVPKWDRDAGSLRMLRIIQALMDLGARVTFLPDNFAPIQPYTRMLQRMGVEVLYGSLDMGAELATIGPKLDMVLLSRPHPTSRWLDMVRAFAPAARVVYDTVDLHWLREARRAALSGAPSLNGTAASNGGVDLDALPPKAAALRELELAMIRATDATLAVSDTERATVQRDVPDANLVVIPTVYDVESYVMAPGERAGILFVGSFEHPPNIDAAMRLVKEVMPVVWQELGDVNVTIVGSNPPAEVQALAAPLVDVAGWVQELEPLLSESRLMVAPIRYGAGMKGKITQALAAGLPVVTTSIGSEGLGEADGGLMLVADDSQRLAQHTIDAYRDEELWWRLSRAGQTFVDEHCSTAVIGKRLAPLLERGMPKGARGRALTG